MTRVLNLYGGPGSGKSTLAAYLFSRLKMDEYSVELVSEAAKDQVWEDNKLRLASQEYIFGVQSLRQRRLKGKVDLIITDSPLPLSIYYNRLLPQQEFKNLVMSVYSTYTNLNIWVERGCSYQECGRVETEEQAKKNSLNIQNMLSELGISCSLDYCSGITDPEIFYSQVQELLV